ncbi:MAG: patatin-like phospholipase family protein [Cyclobacteriaceae bacterium]
MIEQIGNANRIGVALSGGGARSIVHLGMLQALEEMDVKPSYISGASAGAIVGALYATGRNPRDILEIIINFNFRRVLTPALNWRGFLKLEKALGKLDQLFSDNSFESLEIPLVVSATNLSKGAVKYFKKGQLIQPLIASCSIPVLFNPVKINGVAYVDGGITDNMPVGPLRKKCDFIIGMHCNPIIKNVRVNNWKDMLERTLLISISSATYSRRKKCQLFLEPQEIGNYKVFDVKKAKEIFNIGYEYGARYFKDQLSSHLDQIK